MTPISDKDHETLVKLGMPLDFVPEPILQICRLIEQLQRRLDALEQKSRR